MHAAYAQLRDFVSREGSAPLWIPPGFDEFDGERARPAAVLILFGVLDAVTAGHEAQNRAVSSDLDVLLLRRAATLRSHPDQVAFPGGRVDPEDDGAVGAALREAHEETGLDPTGVEVIGELGDLGLPFSDHRVTPVVGWWRRQSPVGVVDPAESAAVFRAPVADLVDPANRFTTAIDAQGEVRHAPAWKVTVGDTMHVVWGFTAGVLDRLLSELAWDEPWDPSREIPLPLARERRAAR